MAPGVNGKRDKYEIVYDILQVCKGGAKKTKLMYGANLSFELQKRYTELLIKKGLLMKQDEMYYITKKGSDILQVLQRYKEKKKDFEDALTKLKNFEI
ncbi:hypothetical protein HS1genome_0573 [Sulfodiicoccus acidiphilus]|uniref:ArnR1-like winged helix-turn-helix domain-containing protein n=1 Tax=Sulfodiicoccus acidiphilus TaxID=1670455 RepID=A0A348B1Y2_9CREN|nr:winged helix-turn-helix domain-containing protein [Sulfodiicoccus acidiphilus]BBD72184.1 hypothetical protein HS1genome_0573 [Sulfodiicoccus acidiphilus]GGT94382.1 hypothetical protein GCM10007116_09970 [Sulfodiicoccus acidiphilus]